jgi:hypothetical protein
LKYNSKMGARLKKAAVALILGAANCVFAQNASMSAADLRERLHHIHTPHSIDNELDRLTTTLQLSQQQRDEVKVAAAAAPRQNPDVDRRQSDRVGRILRIHSISDETHHQINALLTDQQLVLVQQVQAQMREEGAAAKSTRYAITDAQRLLSPTISENRSIRSTKGGATNPVVMLPVTRGASDCGHVVT